MLLITFNEWFGPTREGDGKVPVLESLTAFVTHMPLPEALLHVNSYEVAHNSKFKASAINFTLLSVATIEYLNPDVREKMRIQLIDDLPTSPEEID